MLFGLELVANLGLRSIEVEFDSTILIGYLNPNASALAYISSLFENIREYVNFIDIVSFAFKSCKYKEMVHRLAV